MLGTLSSLDPPILRSPLTFCPHLVNGNTLACGTSGDQGFPRRGVPTQRACTNVLLPSATVVVER